MVIASFAKEAWEDLQSLIADDSRCTKSHAENGLIFDARVASDGSRQRPLGNSQYPIQRGRRFQ